jgi:hypothetical protein
LGLITIEPSFAVIPYQAPEPKSDQPDVGSSISSTLPMAAMFMRNKLIGWYVWQCA